MISVENITVCAGAFALREVSFQIASGDYAVLMGRTGTGKTTLLESICGLRSIESGRVCVGGRDVTQLAPAARGVSYVPQDRALFMTMTVRENLGFGLKIRRRSSAGTARKVNELAGLLGLTELLDRLPHHLSGGEAQRVALGRALAVEPAVLCLDEPLGALDDETREEMHTLLRSLHEKTRATILHVTHHADDANKLATKLLRLREGRVEEMTVGRT